MAAEDQAKMSTRVNWRFLIVEFIVIVVGVLMALWVDQLREARDNSELEHEYPAPLVPARFILSVHRLGDGIGRHIYFLFAQ